MPPSLRRACAAVAMTALLVAGVACSADDQDTAPPPSTEPTSEPSEPTEPTDNGLGPGQGIERFYAQEVAWTDCGSDFECATVQVPVDYDDLTGDTTGLSVNRRPATDARARIGSLLVNPGGPGGSGVEYATAVASQLGTDVQSAYDVVGFDPRGVVSSEPIVCLETAELDEFIAFDPDPDTDAEASAALDLVDDFGQACEQAAPDLLPHLSTVDVARDMDVLRAVLGDEQLHYLGASYGTFIGSVYAELFPDRVARMVLDGAVDPSLSNEEGLLQQATGFETALRAYVDDCVQQDDCPLGDDTDVGLQRVADLLAELDEQPLPTGEERELTEALGVYGIILPLYAKEAWPALTSALTLALDGDGGALLTLADLYLKRTDSGYSDNSAQVIYAVNCLDRPSDATVEEIQASVPAFEAASPTLGSLFAWTPLACTQWPVEAASPVPEIDAQGAAPILVVGTTRDPATPYVAAQALAEQLDSGVLLTREGDGHTGYNVGNECIDDAVDAYLVDGTVPPEGTRC